MRYLLVLLILPLQVSAQFKLYACVTANNEYVVGAKLRPSGLFENTTAKEWRHEGYNHPFLFGFDYAPDNPAVLYVAAGNGLIRISSEGAGWRELTGSDVTELRDVVVDRNDPRTIYFGYSHGIRVSHDGGTTWHEIGSSLRRKYTECLRLDRGHRGVILAGGEEGVFRSENSGQSWSISGAAGFQITRIEQSPHNDCEWLATSQSGGLFASHDCGRTFESAGRIGLGNTLYDVAFDPLDPKIVALAGWQMGVAISEDGGKSWTARNEGLSAPEVISIAIDPVKKGRMYAGVHNDCLYVSQDEGRHWSKYGLEGSIVNRMKFIPEVAAK